MKRSKGYILVASGNVGKFRELGRILASENIELVDWQQVIEQQLVPEEIAANLRSGPPEVEETEATYVGNAKLKARAYHTWSGLPCLADDSGLEVDALGGAPGLYSARYAGENVDFDANIRKLLDELSGCESRHARFVCTLVLKLGDGKELVAEGNLNGEITEAKVGQGGFGYDPVFKPTGSEFTLAELKAGQDPSFKTHRVLAGERLLELINREL